MLTFCQITSGLMDSVKDIQVIESIEFHKVLQFIVASLSFWWSKLITKAKFFRLRVSSDRVVNGGGFAQHLQLASQQLIRRTGTHRQVLRLMLISNVALLILAVLVVFIVVDAVRRRCRGHLPDQTCSLVIFQRQQVGQVLRVCVRFVGGGRPVSS